MIIAMIYAALVASIFAVAAACAERLLADCGRSRRSAWIVALVAGIGVPVAALIVGAGTPSPGSVTVPTVAATAAGAHEPGIVDSLAAWDSAAIWLWIVASVALVSSTALLWLRLRATVVRLESAYTEHGEIRVSDSLGPAVFGLLSPAVILPRWMLDAPGDTRAVAIAHEREHVAAGDHLLLMTTRLAVALCPWNLPLWWIERRLRLAVELDCDRRVLDHGWDASAYGEVLLAVARRRSRVPLAAPALTEPVTHLERRIRTLLNRRRRPSPARMLSLCAAIAGLGACAAQIHPPPLPAPAAADSTVPTDRDTCGRFAEFSVPDVEISSCTVELLAAGVVADQEAFLLDQVSVRVSGVESRVHAAEVSHDPSAGTTVLRDAEFLIDGIRITTPEATVTSTAEGDSILTMKTATIVTDQ